MGLVKRQLQVRGIELAIVCMINNEVLAKTPSAKVEPSPSVYTTVFYQGVYRPFSCIVHSFRHPEDFTTNKIHALTRPCGQQWGNPVVVPVDPLVVTALAAAVSNKDDKAKVHLYYQEKGITLRESVYNGAEWSKG